jgi:branched-chain amino acid transport system substrate-binding protein
VIYISTNKIKIKENVMKKFVSVLLVMVLALSLSVLPVSAESKGVIKLGGLAPLTGNYAEYGKGFQIGWQMAIDEINAAGGANGYMLEIDVKDTQGDTVVSSTMATAFAEDDDVLAILGDFTSGACKANASIVDRYGIVQLSPTASAPDYAAMSPFCFSIMGRQDREAPFLATYVLKKYLGVEKVAVIRVDSDWGLACFENFKAQADVEGLEVTEEKYKSDETDFSSIITKVKLSEPDVLVVMDQGAAVSAIFNAADAADWDVKHVALGPGTSEQVVSQLMTPDNIIVTSPFFFDPENEELTKWKEEFTGKAGFEPTVHPACAYDTMYLIKTAIENIGDGEVTRDAIRAGLQELEMQGVTGRIKFEPAGDIQRDYMICGVENGEWVVLKGFDYVNE